MRYEVYHKGRRPAEDSRVGWYEGHKKRHLPDGVEARPSRMDFDTLEEANEAMHRVSYDMMPSMDFYILRVDGTSIEVVFGDPTDRLAVV